MKTIDLQIHKEIYAWTVKAADFDGISSEMDEFDYEVGGKWLVINISDKAVELVSPPPFYSINTKGKSVAFQTGNPQTCSNKPLKSSWIARSNIKKVGENTYILRGFE